MTEYAVDVQGISKSFHGKKVVDDVALQVKKGEIYGFLGPNGSGKTTTIRMICGLLKPDQGAGHCLGFDIQKQAKDIKRKVGYMTQKFSLYGDLTVIENLNFIARAYQVKDYKTQVRACLERLKFPQSRWTQQADGLSGGWKQRLALAAALIHSPDLLLLDEPTAGVDPQARRAFWDEIHALSEQGITTLVSTHYMDEAERCHQLAYIAYGHMLAKGTVSEIIAQSGLFAWEVQGHALQPLAAEVRSEAVVEQVASFGEALHVIGRDPAALNDVALRYQQRAQWSEIQPSLEDVFIHLVAEAMERYQQ